MINVEALAAYYDKRNNEKKKKIKKKKNTPYIKHTVVSTINRYHERKVFSRLLAKQASSSL